MQKNNWVRLLALLTIVTSLAVAIGASGQGKSGGTFATVDFKKLSTGYKARESVDAELRVMQKQYEDKLQRRNNMPFLTEEEQKQLDLIYEKTPQTDADKAKITAIESKAKTKSDEIQAIRQKPEKDLNAADKATLAAADKIFQEAQGKFASLKEDLANQLSQYGNSKSEDLMKKVRATIGKVAESKNVAVVFNSEVALYAGTDITEAVLAELNKK